MREIKFRAWDENVGVIYSWEDLKEYHSIVAVFHAVLSGELSNCKVMQYTGLKDSQGREIYEGDIVSYRGNLITEDWENIDAEDWEYDTKVDVVTMERFPCYWLKNESFGYEGEDLVTVSDTEIIGNIHENPELLNDK